MTVLMFNIAEEKDGSVVIRPMQASYNDSTPKEVSVADAIAKLMRDHRDEIQKATGASGTRTGEPHRNN